MVSFLFTFRFCMQFFLSCSIFLSTYFTYYSFQGVILLLSLWRPCPVSMSHAGRRMMPKLLILIAGNVSCGLILFTLFVFVFFSYLFILFTLFVLSFCPICVFLPYLCPYYFTCLFYPTRVIFYLFVTFFYPICSFLPY